MSYSLNRTILNNHLKIIFDFLIPYATRLAANDESEFLFSDEENISYIYLVEAGHFLVKDLSSGVSIKTVESPNILGVAQFLYPDRMNLFAIEHISRGVIFRIGSQQAIDIISKQGGWQSLAYFLAFQIGFLSNRQNDRSSYNIIRSLLIEMSHEPDEIIKSCSIEKYITERSHLGRSGIMKILSDLRKGGYVEIKRGKLIKINKLPERY